MAEMRTLAQKLFEIECGFTPPLYDPYHRPPSLDDLWPSDQERYLKMAEALILPGVE